MQEILQKAIQAVQESQIAYSKFITPNDTGATGGHQSGFHIAKNAWSLLFDEEGQKGSNKEKFVTINWQDNFETQSRFIYYGVGTRNEYRITRFQKGFPFLSEDNVGDLLILCKKANDYYEGFVLQTDDEMEEFFTAVNISANNTNQIIPSQFAETAENILLECFNRFIDNLKVDFPPTVQMALQARRCYNTANNLTAAGIRRNPDKQILEWVNAEFQLFRMVENSRYSHLIQTPFQDVEQLVKTANQILNRRKSRAGRSLEHHLDEIFRAFEVTYETQVITEGKKIPDFIFPGKEAYDNPKFDENKLIFLGAKTTCKDRWRQITSEADRIRTKHLFTLQQGVSKNQLREMTDQGVRLVVPKQNKFTFPEEFREQIFSLENFIGYVNQVQGK
ncbi:type II restriction endonuclease [Zunongwangia sp. F260]|uniref:Type II restriction endonuclease n=1 Tax=Autumnicola lenta TaxID=3075593 RepID=A0ABU3CHF9_9FLAO|nr:type II restriction endonuclease [Zunongwangia sp. F260]MDT0645787.1 type II restriction endonuclease [Zunongwangia sp. F260]